MGNHCHNPLDFNALAGRLVVYRETEHATVVFYACTITNLSCACIYHGQTCQAFKKSDA